MLEKLAFSTLVILVAAVMAGCTSEGGNVAEIDGIVGIVLQLGSSSTPAPPFTLGVVGAMALMSFGLRRGRSV